MQRIIASLRDERGVALVMALIMLVVLTGLALAFLSVSAFEPQIAENLASSAQARMVADGGLEWAFNQLATVPAGLTQEQYWNNLLAAAAGGATLTGGDIPLPGLTAASGVFRVTVRNDTQANDNQLTGCPTVAGCDGNLLDPGGAATDTNGRLIVTATSTITGVSGLGNVTKNIVAVMRRPTLPTINAAMSFPGKQADVNFSGSSFDIQGIDHKIDGTPGTASAVYGITTSGDNAYLGNEATVENALQNNQQNQVLGKSEVPPGLPTSGVDAIQADPALTMDEVTAYVNWVKTMADVQIDTAINNKFTASGIGSSCPADWSSTTCWGTLTDPKIVYVKGTPGVDYVSVDLSGGSVGTGILIIENGRFEVTGDFRWNGPIIVTGTNVGINYKGGGNQEVFGAVIVNELNDTGQNNLEGEVKGNAKIYYSKEALDLVVNRRGRRFMAIYSWREQ